MTINLADNSPRVSYAVAAGVTQSSFTVSFEFFEDADLNVYVDGTLKTLTTDYTVSGGDGSTGSVSISVTGASGGSTVVITRSIALERTTDFPSSGPFDIASLNTELDKVVAIAADLKDRDDRALKLTDYDSAVSLVLPDVDTRKGKVLAFNASTGAVEAGPAISDTETIANIATDIATLADIEDGTDATDAIQTVSGISSDVTTVAGVSGNVTTVAGISADVTAVAGDAADIGTVAGISANVSTVAGISSDVTTAAGISANITTVAGDSTDIQALAAKTTELGLLGTADAIADMNTLATSAIVTDLDLLADVKADIESLGDITANITTVAGISANVTTVAGISANTTTVAGISSNVTSVAGISSDVTTVAGQISPTNNIATVAGNNTNITTVAGNNANISTVAGISSNITTVAGISSDVTTVAGDSADIQTLANNIGTISTKANAGANSDITALSGITGNIDLADNAKAQFGAGNDLQIYHDGSNSFVVDTGTGGLQLRGSTFVALQGTNGENGVLVTENGSAQLRYNNSPKLETTGTGVDVTGNLSVSGEVDATTRLTVSGASPRVNLTDTDTNYDSRINADSSVGNLSIDVDINSEATAPAFVVNVQGSEKFRTKSDGVDITGELQADSLDIDGAGDISGNLTLGGNLDMSDNDKILLGTSDDAEIYHDGSNTYFTESGTGRIYITTNGPSVILGKTDGENMLIANTDGAVDIYHNNVKKFATSSTGVTVTGTALATTNTDTTNTGSVTLDFGANQNFVLTLTGNVTLANPSTEQVGQSGFIIFIQDSTGSRTVSLGTDYETAGGAGLTLSTAASSVDIVPYVVQSAGNILLGAPQLAFS